jgi:hypothetical protein
LHLVSSAMMRSSRSRMLLRLSRPSSRRSGCRLLPKTLSGSNPKGPEKSHARHSSMVQPVTLNKQPREQRREPDDRQRSRTTRPFAHRLRLPQ